LNSSFFRSPSPLSGLFFSFPMNAIFHLLSSAAGKASKRYLLNFTGKREQTRKSEIAGRGEMK